VATDTIFSDTPAIFSGEKMAQLFVGKKTLVADVHPMKSEKQFVNTLEDNIRKRGAMSKLISDSAKSEISKKVLDILRALHISNWMSEPYHQNQNPAERRYRTIKNWTNTIMNRTGAPAYCWLLCLQYVCYLLNHIACESLGGQIPLFMLTGITPDISILLLFTFYQQVYYATHDKHFPSRSEERSAYWVGFGEHVGDSLTHKLLDADTNQIIYRAAVRKADDVNPNRRTAPFGGEIPNQDPNAIFIRSRQGENPNVTVPMAEFNPDDLIGRTFLTNAKENGERHRAKVMKKIVEEIENDEGKRVQQINFLLDIGEGKAEEIISYNQLLEYMERDQNEEDEIGHDTFNFRAITGHQGPLNPNDPDWKGSMWNVQVHWETGEVTYEPLSLIAADDFITCAVYAKEHKLLNTPGWKRFRTMAKRQKVLARAVKQSKIRQIRRAKTFKYGFQVPRTYKEALELDKANGNTKWYDATQLELSQIHDYGVFKDGGKAVFMD